MEDPLSPGPLCTYSLSRKRQFQLHQQCLTCSTSKMPLVVCSSCAQHCHAQLGHSMGPLLAAEQIHTAGDCKNCGWELQTGWQRPRLMWCRQSHQCTES
mmetsp:Transcript_20820/g.46372  ORF Transcript_20820/g.46372 Transcript_20820/m.46372 type:complete len:99 (+) Transcript_20820:357-653(+)